MLVPFERKSRNSYLHNRVRLLAIRLRQLAALKRGIISIYMIDTVITCMPLQVFSETIQGSMLYTRVLQCFAKDIRPITSR